MPTVSRKKKIKIWFFFFRENDFVIFFPISFSEDYTQIEKDCLIQVELDRKITGKVAIGIIRRSVKHMSETVDAFRVTEKNCPFTAKCSDKETEYKKLNLDGIVDIFAAIVDLQNENLINMNFHLKSTDVIGDGKSIFFLTYF